MANTPTKSNNIFYQVDPSADDKTKQDKTNFIFRELFNRLGTLSDQIGAVTAASTAATPVPVKPPPVVAPPLTDTGPPGDLVTATATSALIVQFDVHGHPDSNFNTLFLAELRIKFTLDPTITHMDLTTPDIDNDNIAATTSGAKAIITMTKPGRYFYTWRVKNKFNGGSWSTWTDGGLTAVTKYVDVNNATDLGPAAGWTLAIGKGPTTNTVVVSATRPTTNNNSILIYTVQVRDTTGGEPWRCLDDNAGAAVTYYDGATIAHECLIGSSIVKRTAGTGFGSASIGDLVLLDVRGGAFQRNYCQLGTIDSFDTGLASTATSFTIAGFFTPHVATDLRVRIVKPPWQWDTEGYFGNPGSSDESGGLWFKSIQGNKNATLVSDPIAIAGNSSNINARVWFENTYSYTDASVTNSSSPTVTTSGISVISGVDQAVPSAPPVTATMYKLTTGNYSLSFKADFPTSNFATATHSQIQISKGTDSTFASPIYDQSGGVPFVGTFTTSEVNVFFVRGRTLNSIGYSNWSTTVRVSSDGTLQTGDTDVPSTPTYLLAVVDDVDATIGGKELVITWAPPTSNTLTLTNYIIEVNNSNTFPTNTRLASGTTGTAIRGEYTLTDSSASFNTAWIGRTVWIHKTDVNDPYVISSGKITSVNSGTSITLNSQIQADGTGSIIYEVITPSWEQVIRETTALSNAEVSRHSSTASNFRWVVTNLPFNTYWVRIRADNLLGIGPWAYFPALSGSGLVVDGVKQTDTRTDLSDKVDNGQTAFTGTATFRGTNSPNGTVSNATKQVFYQNPDSQSSKVVLYWDYTIGSIIATKFALTITDGTATFVYEVPCLGTAKHAVTINRLNAFKSVSVSLTEELITSTGTVSATVWNPTLWTGFPVSSDSGSDPGGSTPVGELDWAGGNVWFGTNQYRNNLAPTNGISLSFGGSATFVGCNQASITVSPPAYTQGTNIATHLAILVRAGGGTISLTGDSIVTLLNMASLPATYIIPFTLSENQDFSFALAAVALTSNGYSFNSTFSQFTSSAQANVNISSLSGQDVVIGPFSGRKTYVNLDMVINDYLQIQNSTTGTGAATLGTNCPVSGTPTPNTWLEFKKSDGSIVYVAGYK